ncbi:hypothetical protein KPL70_021600 [Citrus sinensis]|nr:hypothetical protein KPL70_021600 [Citrus sinensis]
MKMRLYTLSIKDGVAMKDHVDEFNKLIFDLENVNIILEDEDKALILLSSLLESYEHFVDTLLYKRQTLTLKDVKNALESKDLNKMAEVKDQSNAEGLVTKGKSKKKNNKQKKNNNQKDKAEKNNKKRKCYFCQKEWHYIKDCFEKKKLEELQKKSNGKATLASEDEGDYDEANVLVAAERHPTGCTIKAENEEIHVTDKGETVMKEVRKNGMYILVGSSPEHGISASVTRDKTKLWHMRLAHISERGLRELSNQGLFGFWAKAVTTAAYLINRSPSSALDFKTPPEIWSGKPLDLSNLRIFGCPAYAHIKDVTFDEGLIFLSKVETDIEATESEEAKSAEQKVEHSNNCKTSEEPSEQFKEGNKSSELKTYQLVKDMERIAIKMLRKYGITYLISYALTVADEVNSRDPLSHREAMCCEDKLKWYATMQDEITSLKKNNTWILVEKPPNKKLVSSKWIFKLKAGASEKEPPRHKARLMDVKTAFLHGNLDEEIFMAQLEGFIEKGSEDKVYLLKKSLYGLKQSPRQCDGGVYLLLYVDDMLIACKQKEEIDKLKVELSTEFEMKDLGATTKILGMQIIKDSDSKTLYLSQADYVKNVLTKFNMEDSKHVTTPLWQHHDAMVYTIPNLAHGVGVISRFMGNPSKDHWNAVKWVLRYLRGTVVTVIVFGNINGALPEVAGFVDSDYAADKDRRRSITGFVFTMCGGAISWKSSLQSMVALSTTEAEYIALTEAVKEAIWLRGLVSELGFKQKVVKVSCDSSSAIQLSKNPKYHERTKHIDVRMHFIRDEIGKGVMNVVKVPSEVNPADMLTKTLPSVRFRNLLNLIRSVSL